jgi:hypothetical protein
LDTCRFICPAAEITKGARAPEAGRRRARRSGRRNRTGSAWLSQHGPVVSRSRRLPLGALGLGYEKTTAQETARHSGGARSPTVTSSEAFLAQRGLPLVYDFNFPRQPAGLTGVSPICQPPSKQVLIPSRLDLVRSFFRPRIKAFARA